jgi:hypothetical protein
MGQRLRLRPGRVAPGRARHLQHAAQQPFRRAAAHQHPPGRVPQQEMRAVAQRPRALRRLARQVGRDALAACRRSLPPGAERAGRAARRADGRPQVEQRLDEIAGPGARGPCSMKRCGEHVQPGLHPRQRAPPRHGCARHPFHIAIESAPPARRRRSRPPPRRYRGRCRAARASASPVAREAFRRGHGLRAGMQVPRAGVVAEARPFLRHLGPIGRASACTVGKRARKRA